MTFSVTAPSGQTTRCTSLFSSHPKYNEQLKAKKTALGDLTIAEVSQIQSIVNEIGFPLVVVGSASKAMRRNVGKNLPHGKGIWEKSDIDYLLPLFWRVRNREERNKSYFYLNQIKPFLKKLPDMDVVFVRSPRTAYPRIWFIPNSEPVFVEANGVDPLPLLPPPIDVPAEILKNDIMPGEIFLM